MRDKLSVVDGTGKGPKAPCPKKGLVKAVYETIDALGGATIKQIKEYLPAAIVNFKQVANDVKLKRCLTNGVYRGYFVHSARGDYYHIAPLDYYETRQKYIEEIEARTMRGYGAPRSHGEAPIARDVEFTRPFWHWGVLVAIGVQGFLVGLLVGVLIP